MIARRVRGRSMLPVLRSGDVVVAYKKNIAVGDIVIAKQNSRDVVKRIKSVQGDFVYLVGDNRDESEDSRHFGSVNVSAILGTVMIVLPKSTKPPQPVKPFGLWIGRVLAAVLVVMCLAHLFRIDTFLPLLDAYLPGGSTFAGFIGIGIILSELFAIPFLLRIHLSPLGHLVSGALVVLSPLWWLLIDVWTLGLGFNTAQFGEFAMVRSTTAILLLNIVWVIASYYGLYTLGYNRLSLNGLLRK